MSTRLSALIRTAPHLHVTCTRMRYASFSAAAVPARARSDAHLVPCSHPHSSVPSHPQPLGRIAPLDRPSSSACFTAINRPSSRSNSLRNHSSSSGSSGGSSSCSSCSGEEAHIVHSSAAHRLLRLSRCLPHPPSHVCSRSPSAVGSRVGAGAGVGPALGLPARTLASSPAALGAAAAATQAPAEAEGAEVGASVGGSAAKRLRVEADTTHMDSAAAANGGAAAAAAAPTAPVVVMSAAEAVAAASAALSSMPESGGVRNTKTKTKTIGTHNGTFHCDEALGCFMLRMTQEFRDAAVVRTRDQSVLDTCDAVLDVGGVYDASRHRYDHHQRGFQEMFGHGFNVTKLSSAGLIYRHFGRELIAERMGVSPQHADVDTVYLAVYRSFVEAVDAIDNGVNQFATDSPPLYQSNTHLGARVGRLNPDWLHPHSDADENLAFAKAMLLAGEEFLESVDYTSTSWLPARTIVLESIREAKEVDPSEQILLLKRYCPWKQHLAELEEELHISADKLPTYVVYQDERGGQWRVQAVSVAPGSFQSRLPLPPAWQGLRDDELSKACSIDGCVFVHSSGFIGGNKSKYGALEMAKKALAMPRSAPAPS